MPVIDNAGRKLGYRQAISDLDEDTLQRIAETTGGKFLGLWTWERRRQLLRPSTKNRGSNLVPRHNYELTSGFLRGSHPELWLF